MPIPIKLDDLVEAMEMQSDVIWAYLNRETGTIVHVYDEAWQAAKDHEPLDAYPEWEQESIQVAREILEDRTGVYVRLPTQHEIHEWAIMDRFAQEVEDERIGQELRRALRRKGAFRRFKDAVHRRNLAEDWYAYKAQALRQIARAWCEEYDIPFEE